MAEKTEKLNNDKVLADFFDAYEAKRKLIEEQRKDHLFSLGKQWDDAVVATLRKKKVKAITDNRVRTNIFLITGLERQNRSDFRAFPEGEEDSIEARIATALFKNIMKQSEGEFKFSEVFEDGITGGESYLELWLDSTFNLLSPKPRWKKLNFDQIFPKPGWAEYDFSDVPYIYKFTPSVEKGDLQTLFPDKKNKIEKLRKGLLDPGKALKAVGVHVQERDYPDKSKDGVFFEGQKKGTFDLLERYYKKWVEGTFVFDTVEGDLLEALPNDDEDKRDPEKIAKDFVKRLAEADPQNADRFRIHKQLVPQIWRYAITGDLEEPLEDKLAWFYPKWRNWPFIPYLAHWTNISNMFQDGDVHLGVQGIVRGSKDSQEEHNKRKTQYLRFLDSTTNSGWLTQQGAWVDRKKVEQFGSTPGINLEYKKGFEKPDRIFPMPISQGHVFSSQESAEAIKNQTGINADLLAMQEGGQSSGRAIILRQRQGVVMVQKLFDNLSRTKKIAGKFLLSQLSEIFHPRAVKRILGPDFIKKNFGEFVQNQQTGSVGQEMTVESERRLSQSINKVLNDVNIGKYDVAVGESIMSETMKKAKFDEIKEFAQLFPGLINPAVIIEESDLPASIKSRILQPQPQLAQGQGGPGNGQRPNGQRPNGQQRQPTEEKILGG